MIVFAARGNGPFDLAYGSARASPSALPIETLVPGYERAKPATMEFRRARVGEMTVAPAIAALKEPIDAKRWILWGALFLAAAALGWMALSLRVKLESHK